MISAEEELASLRLINRQTAERLRAAESALSEVRQQITPAIERSELLQAEIGRRIAAETAVESEVRQLVDANARLREQVSALQSALERVSVIERGCFPFVGLTCSVGPDGAGVAVMRAENPAVGFGIAAGDVLLEATVTKRYVFDTLADFETFVVELLPDSTVSIRTSRQEVPAIVPLVLRDASTLGQMGLS